MTPASVEVGPFADDDAVLSQLEAFVRARLGPATIIEGFSRVTSGRSRQNWLFDAMWLDGAMMRREPLIVRRDPLGGLLDTDRGTEFAVLRALADAPIPTPQARWLDAKGEELGRPSLVMVRIAGSCDYFALNGSAPLPDRISLARRLCSLMVDVHGVDWRDVGLADVLVDPGPQPSLAALEHWEAVLRRDQLEPYPELELGAQWLRGHAPLSPRTALVHGDFKVGNTLLDDEGQIVALLDWELAHLGDPHEDLGWVTQSLRTKEHYIKGSWEREDLLRHYEEVSGHTVDHESVAWWNAMAAYKTAVMQASGLRAFVEGRSPDHYQPSAAVLGAVLNVVSAPTAPTPRSAPAGDRNSFLARDTAATEALLEEFGGFGAEVESRLGPEPSSRASDAAATNRVVRGRLVELIKAVPPAESGDPARRAITAHLQARTLADPSLVRRKG